MANPSAWIAAFRLRTLPLALSSILVGSALAKAHGSFNLTLFVLALLTATLLQVLSNLANDLGDHEHGTDNEERVGPARAVQSGAISPAAMKSAMLICGVLAFGSGVTLICYAFGFSIQTILFLFIGLASIGAAIKYTYGKNPYGYAGLGDVSVFLFFGLVGVLGTYYLYTQAISESAIPFAVAFGLLSAAVLNLNNMRDIENDAKMGKQSLAVKLGESGSKRYHTFLVVVPILIIIYWLLQLVFFSNQPPKNALGFLPIIVLIPLLLLVVTLWKSLRVSGATLDPFLKKQALSTFFLALTISLLLFLR